MTIPDQSSAPLCACGCGQPTKLSPKHAGYSKYLHGHNARSDVSTRFWNRTVVTETGCWEWQGTRNEHGYGGVSVNGRWRKAHQVSWELTHGPIPHGMELLHSCDNPPCVNPDHLSLGTHRDNMHDMSVKGRAHGSLPGRPRNERTHCPHGHEYTEENSYYETGTGYRRCRKCSREYASSHREQSNARNRVWRRRHAGV